MKIEINESPRSIFPRRRPGNIKEKDLIKYENRVSDFIKTLISIQSGLDFKMSARGWCYVIEGKNLINKSDFDACEKLINTCRKNGMLPNGFIAGDKSRGFSCVERFPDFTTPEEEAECILVSVQTAHRNYIPKSFWDDQPCYVQMLVEKVDLISLFYPICEKYKIPISNARGWSVIGQRKELAFRFKRYEKQGKIPVLLYCGDFDPKGLQISNTLKSNLDSIYRATEWKTDNLVIDRFGLNYDFIIENNLTWIDNLITGSGGDLSNTKHRDHFQAYVQDYVAQYGAKKCEANAIVVVPEMGRELCEAAINKYISAESVNEYRQYIHDQQNEVWLAVQRLLENMKGGNNG